ncbi:DoxX family protein [soil metagenome]
MKITSLYQQVAFKLTSLRDLPLLALRLVLAYGFFGPAMMKLNDIGAIAGWFESMGMPMPTLNAYMATFTEVAGVVLLALGLATRFITIPLIIVMLVAIITVHWGNGFDAGDNGFEIPLYYIIMLFTLLILGPGKISLDALIKKYNNAGSK